MAGGRGKTTQFQRTLEQAELDSERALWKAQQGPGCCYSDVARHFGISVSTAYDSIRRAMDAAAAAGGREALGMELLKLDMLEVAALDVLKANHIYVSDGRVVKDDGEPITDYKPVLMAVDRLLRISERRSKLNGLDAPTKQTITVVTEDAVDAELRRLAELHEQLSADADTHA